MADVAPSDPGQASRFGQLHVTARGAEGNGHAPSVGSGGYTPCQIRIPTTQSVDAFEILTAAGVVLARFDQFGNLSISSVTNATRKVAQASLTAANIIAMFTTPVSILPAPASGHALIVERIVVELNLTATAFTGGGVVHFYYHGQTTEIMAQTLAAATVQGASGQTVWALNPVATAGGSVVTPAVGVDITNAGGVFAAGTGTAIVTVSYVDLLL